MFLLDAIRQLAITWTNADTDLCHHMASLGQNELTHGHQNQTYTILQMPLSNAFSWLKILNFDYTIKRTYLKWSLIVILRIRIGYGGIKRDDVGTLPMSQFSEWAETQLDK